MDDAFSSLAVVQLPTQCRLLSSSCCPDKDLLVVVSRLGGQDRISLWKVQGYKIWDVDLDAEDSNCDVVALAWSPDGQSIAVAHNPATASPSGKPPTVTLRSIQDGHEQRVLHIPGLDGNSRISHLSWFKHDKVQKDKPMPDTFKRNGIITGSAHSVLKMLPLLDNIHEDTHKFTATNVFAFQGSQTRLSSKSSVPEAIKTWPALPVDLRLASLSALEKTTDVSGEQLKETDDANIDSILSIGDTVGNVHYFLDGSFPLGAVGSQNSMQMSSMDKHPRRPLFFSRCAIINNERTMTDLYPTTIELPLLQGRHVRDLARLSSTARELTWYMIRAIKEMRTAWFGSETSTGAHKLGLSWVQAFEQRQRDNFEEESNAILDFTILLTTGRGSEALHDFLTSGEQMSDRSIQKWDTTMSEALSKLRDYAEKRVAPACQRLFIVLDEVKGWSQIPKFQNFDLSLADISRCLDHTRRAIIISSWLAAAARREYRKFKEFITWIRFEIVTAANATSTENVVPRHDILEVNNYLMSGLTSSQIDNWLLGPIPSFHSDNLGVPRTDIALGRVMERAKQAIEDSSSTKWQATRVPKDFSHIDRNLEALINELAGSCQKIFDRASSSTSRAARISNAVSSVVLPKSEIPPMPKFDPFIACERSFVPNVETDEVLYQLAMMTQMEDRSFLCICRLTHSSTERSQPVQYALAELLIDGEPADLELVNMELFDDSNLVVVYRNAPTAVGRTCIALAGFGDIEFRPLNKDHFMTREELMLHVIERWKEGQLPSSPIHIQRTRRLHGCDTGKVSLAVNGRRKLASLLDAKGTTLECLDLEVEPDEIDEDTADADMSIVQEEDSVMQS